jgi:hypothetical protein
MFFSLAAISSSVMDPAGHEPFGLGIILAVDEAHELAHLPVRQLPLSVPRHSGTRGMVLRIG